MLKWIIAASSLALAVTPAAAQQGSEPVRSSGGFLFAGSLYVSCSSAEPNEVLACRTYMMAIADGMAMHKDNGWAPQVLCNATALRIDQLGQLYVDYYERHTERGRWTAASVAYSALAERFPCTGAN